MTSSLRSLTPDQQDAITELYGCDALILVAGTGVGKTVIAQTAIMELIDDKALNKVIVACPAKVLEKMIWPNEATKWVHLRDLRILQLEGTSQQRTKALLTSGEGSHIIMVSLNNLDWLLSMDHDCDGIVIDELSKAAGKQTAGLKSKKKADRFVWRVGMTATPVSQNFEKIWAYERILNHGKILGRNKRKYLEEYFYSDYQGYNWTLKNGADAKILEKVASLVHLVKDNKVDVLPPKREGVLKFTMPAETREKYNEMKKDMVVGDREAANSAIRSGVLRQIASGFYYQEGETVTLDEARAEAAMEWAQSLNGASGIIFYEFVEQREQLAKIPTNIMLAQIQSMSHGIDGLQDVFADALFYQPPWSRDQQEQSVGRIWRQNQKKPVTITTLVCENTLDELVMARVEDRGRWMELFKQHLEKE
jgi:SNF2 family DNA or RNA helicase